MSCGVEIDNDRWARWVEGLAGTDVIIPDTGLEMDALGVKLPLLLEYIESVDCISGADMGAKPIISISLAETASLIPISSDSVVAIRPDW